MKNESTRLLIMISIFIGFGFPVQSQTVTNYAGTASGGFSGDGGDATAAQIYAPVDASTDGHGNIYVADYGNNRIRRIDPSTGIISTVAGGGSTLGDGGPATAASLYLPTDICFDKFNNMYIADCANDRIRKVSAATGIITTIAGTGTIGFSGDGGPATAAKINHPGGICLDTAGNVYFGGNDCYIRKITVATGIISTLIGNGSSGYTGDGGPSTAGRISYPRGLCTDLNCNLYIADNNNNVVRKINAATGIVTTFAGTGTSGYSGDGGQATNAHLNDPHDICLDPMGNLCIADYANGRIRKVKLSSGIINGYATVGSPFGVCCDSSGNLFIPQFYSSRLQKIGTCISTVTYSSMRDSFYTDTMTHLRLPVVDTFHISGGIGATTDTFVIRLDSTISHRTVRYFHALYDGCMNDTDSRALDSTHFARVFISLVRDTVAFIHGDTTWCSGDTFRTPHHVFAGYNDILTGFSTYLVPSVIYSSAGVYSLIHLRDSMHIRFVRRDTIVTVTTDLLVLSHCNYGDTISHSFLITMDTTTGSLVVDSGAHYHLSDTVWCQHQTLRKFSDTTFTDTLAKTPGLYSLQDTLFFANGWVLSCDSGTYIRSTIENKTNWDSLLVDSNYCNAVTTLISTFDPGSHLNSWWNSDDSGTHHRYPCSDTVWTTKVEYLATSCSPQIFPNPIKDILRIRYPGNFTFGILDPVGRVFWSGNFDSQNKDFTEIVVSDVPPGIYIIRIKAQGTFFYQKIIKE